MCAEVGLEARPHLKRVVAKAEAAVAEVARNDLGRWAEIKPKRNV